MLSCTLSDPTLQQQSFPPASFQTVYCQSHRRAQSNQLIFSADIDTSARLTSKPTDDSRAPLQDRSAVASSRRRLKTCLAR
ncbi:hypothetical protein WJX79_005587 [Trebouxia sp. C0005]